MSLMGHLLPPYPLQPATSPCPLKTFRPNYSLMNCFWKIITTPYPRVIPHLHCSLIRSLPLLIFTGNLVAPFLIPNEEMHVLHTSRPVPLLLLKVPSQSGPSAPRASCRIYGKSSHQALDCYHCMDYTFQGRHPPPQLAAMIAQKNTLVEDEWYADSGANAHITADLDKLSLQQPFNGQDTVAVGNGPGLQI